MSLQVLPSHILYYLHAFLNDQDSVAFGSSNKQIWAISQQTLRSSRARARWHFLRDVVRLARRVGMARRLLSQASLLKNLTQRRLFMTLDDQEAWENARPVIRSWTRCMSNAFPRSKLRGSFMMAEQASCKEIPCWLWVCTCCMVLDWFMATM